jgi:hypothetical protein
MIATMICFPNFFLIFRAEANFADASSHRGHGRQIQGFSHYCVSNFGYGGLGMN